ncbi:MAG TPA: BolA/IbaG family iron-sulfur metabolism protein [Halothiobacillus sp.]|nr:BolA/IbaG family iron-sulfur metabolism protein [Halothiobacillus sp.]
MNPQDIIQQIQAELPDAQVNPEGEGCNFRIEVISSAFAGKSMLQQHQLVNKILAPAITSGALHAVTLNTRAPKNA